MTARGGNLLKVVAFALITRIPMSLQRRGGHKLTVPPNGSDVATSAKPQPDCALIKALGSGVRWQRVLDKGPVRLLCEKLAEAERSATPTSVEYCA